jgi:hypothetical protein
MVTARHWQLFSDKTKLILNRRPEKMNDQLISKTASRNLKFSSARKLVSSFLEKTRPYQRTVRCGFVLAVAFFAFASSASAQPTMSRGEQLLPISYNECIRRAEQAYIAEGWVNIGKGGAFVNAFKENNGAYITCNVAPENKIWANIFVASNSGDSNVPGGERVKLQTRMGMEGPVSGGCGLGMRWQEEEASWRSVWTRRGSSNVFDASYTGPGGERAATVNVVTIEGNRVSIKRSSSSDGYGCNYEGIVQPDGVTINGSYNCGAGSMSWKATISCQ